jgi:hypothetical protein
MVGKVKGFILGENPSLKRMIPRGRRAVRQIRDTAASLPRLGCPDQARSGESRRLRDGDVEMTFRNPTVALRYE